MRHRDVTRILMSRYINWAAIVWFMLIAAPAYCQPKAIVVFADGLRWADIYGSDGTLSNLRTAGSVALLSEGLPTSPDPTGIVYRNLATGGLDVPDKPQYLDRFLNAHRVRYALIGDCDGDDTGEYRPERCFLVPTVGPASKLAVTRPTAAGGKATIPGPTIQRISDLLMTNNLVVVQWGDLIRLQREWEMGLMTRRAYDLHRANILAAINEFAGQSNVHFGSQPGFISPNIWIVSPTPPFDGKKWTQLGVVWRSGSGSGGVPGLLTSTTTHVPGLVAVRDFAPSLLADLGLTQPTDMTGAPVTSVPATMSALSDASAMDAMTSATQRVQVPLFTVLGTYSGLIAFAALFAASRRLRNVRLISFLKYGLRTIPGWMLGLLLVPMVRPSSALEMSIALLLITVTLALLGTAETLYVACGAAVLMDAVSGSHNLSLSPLSAYPLTGIRFYGVGNEYMGLAIAGALLAAYYVKLSSAGGRHGTVMASIPLAITVAILVAPMFGAKAGSAISASIPFVCAIQLFRCRPVKLSTIAIGLLTGIAILAIATLAGKVAGTPATHVDLSIRQLSSGNAGYIISIAVRKLGMALRIAAHPGTIIGGTALIALLAVSSFVARTTIKNISIADPFYAAILTSGMIGAIACVVWNDSGVVAAILLVGALAVTFLQRCVVTNCES